MTNEEKKAKRFALYKKDSLLTSKLVVKVDKDRFFERFGIIRFKSADPKLKQLPYATLAGLPILAVAGIADRFLPDPTRFSTWFFLLVNRVDMPKVCEFLQGQPVTGISIDKTIQWQGKQFERVIASLAVNSLGRLNYGRSMRMYNNGSLLLFDDRNFDFDREKDGIVGLKMEITPYLLLLPKTQTFSHPLTASELKNYVGDVFQVSSRLDGELWWGETMKPISIVKDKEDTYPLDELYIKKAANDASHNRVDYWPFDRDGYTRGKLFAMWEVLEQVNRGYEGLVALSFNEVTSYDYDEYESSKEMTNYLKSYMRRRTISIVDPFKNERSKLAIEQLVEKWHHPDLMGDEIQVVEEDLTCPLILFLTREKPTQNDIAMAKTILNKDAKAEKEGIEKLDRKVWTKEYCEAILADDLYHRLDDLIKLEDQSVQHMIVRYLTSPIRSKTDKKKAAPAANEEDEQNPDIVFEVEEEETESEEKKKKTYQKKKLALPRRILLEFMVKDCLRQRQLPAEMVSVAPGWRFWEYRIIEGVITGSWLELSADGRMLLGPFLNTVSQTPYFYDLFVDDVLRYPGNPRVFQGSQDYKVFSKDGNVYMIINTEEIPVLSSETIIEAYQQLEEANEKISSLKRTAVAHENFSAYIGFHIWEVETFDKVLRAWSYTNGVYRSELNISEQGSISRMPRIKFLYLLSAERPDLVDEQLTDIIQMLKYGMGRWREMMTYPFPYKFLQEFLDRETECTYGFHWYEMNRKRVRKYEEDLTKQHKG